MELINYLFYCRGLFFFSVLFFVFLWGKRVFDFCIFLIMGLFLFLFFWGVFVLHGFLRVNHGFLLFLVFF